MAKSPTGVVLNGEPVLRTVAVDVPKHLFNTSELADIINAMVTALRKEKSGVAIAAPQIGVSYRIFVVRGFIMKNAPRNAVDEDVVFINPVITKATKTLVPMDGEGCLSVPGVFGTTMRSPKVTVEARDSTGKKFSRSGQDTLAHIFQHEIDHLNGILFIDHATGLHDA